jgi:hypothetical protein
LERILSIPITAEYQFGTQVFRSVDLRNYERRVFAERLETLLFEVGRHLFLKMLERILGSVHVRSPRDDYFPVGKNQENSRSISGAIDKTGELLWLIFHGFQAQCDRECIRIHRVIQLCRTDDKSKYR